MRKKKKHFFGKLIKFVFLLSLLVVIFMGSIYVYSSYTEYEYTSADGTNTVIEGKKEYVTALICGVNSNLTDTIMFVKFDVQNGDILIMSIPRDTYVDNIYCVGHKINAIYRGKNVIPLVEEIQGQLNEEIDYYMIFDTDLVHAIVDEIGGVEVDVPFDMQYDDPTQDLHIDLKAGKQVLNGEQVEQYVRFRHNNDMTVQYAMGDLGRVETQQDFMKQLISTILKPQNLLKIKDLVDIITTQTETNITWQDILRYGLDAIKLKDGEIITKTASGEATYIGNGSYFLLDQKDTRQVIKEAFNE